MCGIFGYLHLDPTKHVDGAAMRAMGDTQVHRGPDDEGQLVDRNVALGHRRLSIIDLSKNGRQPLSNEDESIWLVFNGEIYNFKELTEELTAKGHTFKSQTDCEVILHLYEESGINCLARLNGMFAFVLWDSKKNECFVARDRLGIKPLHYTIAQGQFIFGSELKAVVNHPSVARTLDHSSLSDYLSFEYVPAPKSIFKDVYKVMPGHYLHVRRGEARSVCYWSTASIMREEGKSEEEHAEELHELLKTSVRRRLVSDVPLGAFLSGGVDSSSVCAMMQHLAPGRVETFNISFKEDSFDESRYAKLVASHLGTHHHVEEFSVKRALELMPRVMDYLDEPLGDASFLPTLLLSQFTRKHVKVSLSGDGADELFAGYPTYLAHDWSKAYTQMPAWLQASVGGLVSRLPVSAKNISFDFKLRKFVSAAGVTSPARRNYLWLGSFSSEEKQALLSQDVWSGLTNHDSYAVAESQYQECRNSEPLQKLLHCDQRFYLQDNMLVKIDRASMAASLEARVPFLDHEIVEFAARLPARYKLKDLVTKHVLKQAMAKQLPQAVLKRNKKGFGIPAGQWFRSELRPLLEEVFEAGALKREGIFVPAEVQRLLSEHYRGKQDHRKKIYTLLNFKLWQKKYLTS